MRLNPLVLVALSTTLPAAGFQSPVAHETQTADSVVSQKDLEHLAELADKKFTKAQVCDDYEIALHLLALVQSPQGHRGNNTTAEALSAELKACPGTYTEVAKAIRKKQMALKDFHTSFRAPEIHAVAAPVITGCTPKDACTSIVGAMLTPVVTEVKKKLYATATASDGSAHFFDLEMINGNSGDELYEGVVDGQFLSKTEGGNQGAAQIAILLRNIIDGRDRAPLEIVARNLKTGEKIQMSANYDADQTILNAQNSNAYMYGFDAAQSYGCVGQAEGSTKNIGGCYTSRGQAVVWVRTWVQFDGDPALVEFTKELLAKNTKAQKYPVIFDMRGNPGGSPMMVGSFVCAFGDDRAVKEMKRRRLNPSLWPATITTLGGRSYLSDSLYGGSNSDLIHTLSRWNVRSDKPDATRQDREVGFFERTGSTDSDCLNERDPRFVQQKWVVLTNGREFSAAENFLSLVEDSNFKFRQLGSNSWGGTGAPNVVTLPNTKMQLRVSLARHIDGVDGGMPIEATGVKADQYITRELSEDFERRLNDMMYGQKDVSGYEYAPLIVRWAFKQQF
jgi:hypothetical protein